MPELLQRKSSSTDRGSKGQTNPGRNACTAVTRLTSRCHSLCTTEFIASRQSYDWLCHALEVYTPRQYEYGRLNLTHTVMSKRHLHRLDDIRLPTLIALRRRGVPPGCIMQFVRGLGVTTAMAVTDLTKFQDNLPDDFLLMVEKPYHPRNPNIGTGAVPFVRVIYIDADDFRIWARRITSVSFLNPGGSVGLLHVPHSITCTSFETDNEGNAHTIIARYDDKAAAAAKPKAFIHWVADCPGYQSPVRVAEVRLVGPLTNSEEIDTKSIEVRSGALLDAGFREVAKQALQTARETARSRISTTQTLPGLPLF
ncbi:ribosomal protein L25/Gln-tRNA synthetase [Mycena rosella]|uniref:glutamine--tRNA ligase n=1 Tax=Mycena rosella TaxID=1033263 RepID=A0AAD7BEC9_MYCRO|nr:ribosomal protein L25/Gln-tRNA synthetase [Mycena rosella]